MLNPLDQFAHVWCVDFEFAAPAGERPAPHCLVAKELRTGKIIRLWSDDLKKLKTPPFPTDKSSLFVAYYASAELG